jgi:hypothetical protein
LEAGRSWKLEAGRWKLEDGRLKLGVGVVVKFINLVIISV